MHGILNWTHTFSPTLVNEFSASAIRVLGDALVNNPEVPGITVTGIEPIQTGWGPNAFVQINFEWRDVASLVRGRHSLKIVGSVTRERADHESSRVFLRPIYSFNSVFDFATDTPFQQSNIGFNPVTGERAVPLFSLIRTGSTAVFIQDDWKVTPSLTVNLGFRWENFWNPTEAECAQCISFLRFQGGDDFPSRIANAKVDLGKNLLDHSLHNFSPRFGFAWDPTGAGKMSVRGGFGLFYDRYSSQLFDGEFTNLPTLANAAARAAFPAQAGCLRRPRRRHLYERQRASRSLGPARPQEQTRALDPANLRFVSTSALAGPFVVNNLLASFRKKFLLPRASGGFSPPKSENGNSKRRIEKRNWKFESRQSSIVNSRAHLSNL